MRGGRESALIVSLEWSMPMTTLDSRADARVGDWLEARGIHGELPRRGEIVELLGHERFRVRWDEQHESIVFPADGVIVVRQRSSAPSRRRD